jgi:hypothetical protein
MARETEMVDKRRPFLPFLLLVGAMALTSCSKPAGLLSDDAKRKEVIEILVSTAPMRQEVVERLIGSPATRPTVIERILKDDAATGDLIAKIMVEDRGKAIVASKVAADSDSARTFIRMLMLTGVMGESMTQKQANALGLGEPFAFGNQRRTMSDLRKISGVIEEFAKKREGRYPVCEDFATVDACLSRKLPSGSLQALRLIDAWGRPVQYRTDREGSLYVLLSSASDGQFDGLGKVGPTDSFDCDIVFSNGEFIQWPGWIRRDDMR